MEKRSVQNSGEKKSRAGQLARLLNLSELIAPLTNTFQRFPLVLLSCYISTAYWLYLSVGNNNAGNWVPLFGALLIAPFAYMPLYLLFEKRGKTGDSGKKISPKEKIPWFFLVTLLLTGYYFLLQSLHETRINYIIFTTTYAVISLIFLIPADKNHPENTAMYAARLIEEFILVIFYSAIIFIGLTIAVMVAGSLFHIPRQDNWIGRIWLALAGGYSPLLYLSRFPKYSEIKKGTLSADAGFSISRFLVKFVITPLSLLYFFILYIYFATIAIKFELPKGMVSTMVISFSLLAIVVHLLLTPYVSPSVSNEKKNETKLFRFIHKILYPLIIPLLVMLTLAIYTRVSEYGITEQRYMVVSAALWIGAISIYNVFSKKRSPVYLFSTSAVLLLLSSFGPWSMFEVSIKSQAGRFYQELVKNGQVNPEGKLVPDFKKAENLNELSSIYRYLKKREALDETAQRYFKNHPPDLGLLSKTLKFNEYPSIWSQYNYFTIDNNNENLTCEISGYTYFLTLFSNDGNRVISYDKRYIFKSDYPDNTLVLYKNNKPVYQIPIDSLVTQLKRIDKLEYHTKTKKKYINFENEYVKGKLLLIYLYGRADQQKIKEVTGGKFIIMFKEK